MVKKAFPVLLLVFSGPLNFYISRVHKSPCQIFSPFVTHFTKRLVNIPSYQFARCSVRKSIVLFKLLFWSRQDELRWTYKQHFVTIM